MALKVNEIFESIQGEGKYTGTPVLFIRLAGCNRRCKFCDTVYAYERGVIMNEKTLVKKIKASDKNVVVITGGEPMVQAVPLARVRMQCSKKQFHLETNGTILNEMLKAFDYVDFSPKTVKDAKKVKKFVKDKEWIIPYDIKVVTNLTGVGKKMIPYATSLMPLTSGWPWSEDDRVVKQKVWKYCVKHDLKYSPRLHVDVFGIKRGV